MHPARLWITRVCAPLWNHFKTRAICQTDMLPNDCPAQRQRAHDKTSDSSINQRICDSEDQKCITGTEFRRKVRPMRHSKEVIRKESRENDPNGHRQNAEPCDTSKGCNLKKYVGKPHSAPFSQ